MITKFDKFVNESNVLELNVKELVDKFSIDPDTARGLSYLKTELKSCKNPNEKTELVDDAIKDLEIKLYYPGIYNDLKSYVTNWTKNNDNENENH